MGIFEKSGMRRIHKNKPYIIIYNMKFTEFIKKFPKYDRYRFSNEGGQVRFIFNSDKYDPFDNNGNLIKTLYKFPSWNGHTYKPEDIRDFLADSAGLPTFLEELMLSKTNYLVFNNNHETFNPTTITIYVSTDQKFTIEPRDVFTKLQPKHKSSKEAYQWLKGPDMSYWPQQLSFAVWCSTSGCGIGVDLLDKYDNMNSLLKFHILFTVRRVLSQMECPLPGDKYFSIINNKYNIAGYNKLCREFDISMNTYYRYTKMKTTV